ncbi:MAG: hypothetical protein R2681_17340 [Pyrinomonadaceae bacterium]
MYSRTCRRSQNEASAWGVVGIIGTSIFVTNGIITNGIEILAFINLELISKQQEFFWLLFRLTRVLFTAEVVTWSFLIFGFSIAGWISKTLPKWLALLGLLNTVFGILAGVFIVSVISDGKFAVLMTAAEFTGLIWFAATAVLMIVRGADGIKN